MPVGNKIRPQTHLECNSTDSKPIETFNCYQRCEWNDVNLLRYAQYGLLLLTTLFGSVELAAQTKRCQPVNDSSAQASPIGTAPAAPATDASNEASPVDASHRGSAKGLTPHTQLHIVLNEAADSGTLKNGQTLHGKLSTPVASNGSGKGSWKAGTPVLITVVGTVPAGKLNAVGELSLELFQVGNQSVQTDVLTFRGQPGHRDLPDSAPMVGTNAGLKAGSALTFSVSPTPSFSESPSTRKVQPGSVTGVASGSKPTNYGQPAASGPGGGNGAAAGKGNPPSNPASTTQPH